MLSRRGYELTTAERDEVSHCWRPKALAASLTGGLCSLLTFVWGRRHSHFPKPFIAVASLLPIGIMMTLAYDDTACHTALMLEPDSQLGADIRSVLRVKYPNNPITAAFDRQRSGRAEEDRLHGTGQPLLWDLSLADSESLVRITAARKSPQSVERGVAEGGPNESDSGSRAGISSQRPGGASQPATLSAPSLLTAPSAAVAGEAAGGDVKRRFVKRNEFGDELNEDVDMR